MTQSHEDCTKKCSGIGLTLSDFNAGAFGEDKLLGPKTGFWTLLMIKFSQEVFLMASNKFRG